MSIGPLLLQARLAGIHLHLDGDGTVRISGHHDAVPKLVEELRANREEVAAELRDPLRSVRRVLLAAAGDLGYPAVRMGATRVGGSRRLWEAFARGARREDVLAEAFRALEEHEEAHR